MLVFIDESGCSGFKFESGSSTHFLIALVVFHSNEDAEYASNSIDELRNKLNWRREFHFTDCPIRVRDAYFEALIKCSFEVRSIVINKQIIHSHHLKSNKRKFYNYFVQSLMSYDNGLLNNARVRIDKSSDRTFRDELKTYLQRQFKGQNKIESVKFWDSKGNDLIQLADMCVGAIGRSYNRPHKNDSCRWKDMLSPKIQDIWEFK